MRKMKVAIIGQGRSGRDIHGAYLQKEEAKAYTEVVAIVDEIADRRVRASNEFHCPVFASYQELFPMKREIDLIINASYSMMHGDITIDLLNHGFHVLCEKPAARSVEEFDQMVAAAQKAGRYFGVFQQSRFAPYFQQVMKVIDSGVLGELIEVDIQFNSFQRRWDWQTLHRFNGGSLRNTGPHPLDQALYILGDPSVMPEVYCRMHKVNSFGDAEDFVKLILSSPGKPLIDLTISCCDAYPVFTYKIHGKNGGLKGTMGHIDWRYFDPDKAPHQELIPSAIAEPDGTPAYCHEILPFVEESWDGNESGAFDTAVDAYYRMVYDHLFHDQPLLVTLAQVRQQVLVYEEAHRQNKTN